MKRCQSRRFSPWSCPPGCGSRWTGWSCPPTARARSQCSPVHVSFLRLKNIFDESLLLTLGVWPCCPPPPPGQPVWTAWPCRTSRGSKVNQGVATRLPLENILPPINVVGVSNISLCGEPLELAPSVRHGPHLPLLHIPHSSQKSKHSVWSHFKLRPESGWKISLDLFRWWATKRNLKRKYFVEIHPFGGVGDGWWWRNFYKCVNAILDDPFLMNHMNNNNTSAASNSRTCWKTTFHKYLVDSWKQALLVPSMVTTNS